jgi:Acetyltransferase (GNAT) domain
MSINLELGKKQIYLAPISDCQTLKEQFIAFAQSEITIPLYMQPWWLDAVCQKGIWDVCLSVDNCGQIEGILVYYQVKLKGLIPALLMPELTPHAGIWLRIHDADKLKTHSYNTHSKRILDTLIAQLPEVPFYTQKFHYSLTDWQPFYWKGYRNETHYTYLLENITAIDTVYNNLKGSVRTDIRKAEKTMVCKTSNNIHLFYSLCEKSFQKQGLQPSFSLETLKILDNELKNRQLRKIYIAYDADGNAHGAIYIVYGVKTAHYLVGGSDPDRRQSGAITLLLWNAIREAADAGLTTFDFEGSMVPSVEFAFRNFGAVQKPFYRISKNSNRFYEILTLFFRNYR